jgi:hypothetical protein
VADQWIDETYVDHFWGDNLRTVAFTSAGGTYATAQFIGIVEAATSIIQAACRNSGYSTPSTTTDVFAKMGTMGAFWEIAAARPEVRLKLPEEWATNALKTAYEAILEGDAPLTLTQNQGGAPGGSVFSSNDEDTTSENGGRSQTFSRKRLQGY